MTDCATGCLTRNQHTPECDNETCRGCRPRTTATHPTGNTLCDRCTTRLTNYLTDHYDPDTRQHTRISTATLHAWLRTNLDATNTTTSGDGIRHTKAEAPPSPINETILDLCDEIETVLYATAVQVSDTANLGRPYSSDPTNTQRILHTHINTLLTFNNAAGVLQQLTDIHHNANTHAPWQDPPQHLTGIPCRSCQQTKLAIKPGHEHTTCLNCGQTYTPREYAWWTRLAAAALDKTTPM